MPGVNEFEEEYTLKDTLGNFSPQRTALVLSAVYTPPSRIAVIDPCHPIDSVLDACAS